MKNKKSLSFNKKENSNYFKILTVIVFFILIFTFLIISTLKNKKKFESITKEKEFSFIPSDEIHLEEIQEITDLIRKYQNAKLTADTKALAKIFGKDEAYINAETLNDLKESSKKFEYFSTDINTYIVDGIRENEYVLFSKIYLKFKKAQNLVPIFLSTYVIKENEAYRFLLDSDMNEEQKNRYKSVSEKEEIQKIYSDYKLELEKAILSDINISDNYKDLVDGEIRFEEKNKTLERLKNIEESKKETSESVGE